MGRHLSVHTYGEGTVQTTNMKMAMKIVVVCIIRGLPVQIRYQGKWSFNYYIYYEN